MRVVSRFESNLLRLLHFFLQRLPREQAGKLLAEARSAPPCLSRPAVELVQDALSKGCVELLVRSGAWRRERFLRGDRVAEGRLWVRTPPQVLGLSFSRHSLEFLVWVTSTRPGEWKSGWKPPEKRLTVGD